MNNQQVFAQLVKKIKDDPSYQSDSDEDEYEDDIKVSETKGTVFFVIVPS
jgi:hypothetical protein